MKFDGYFFLGGGGRGEELCTRIALKKGRKMKKERKKNQEKVFKMGHH